MARLSISNAWDETRLFLGREMRLVAPLALALLFLPGVLAGLAAPRGGPGNPAGSPLFLGLMLAEGLIAALAQLAIARLALGHRERLGDSIGHAARRLPSYVGAVLLIAAPLSLAFSLISIASVAANKSGNAAAAMALLVVLTVLMVVAVIAVTRALLNTAVAAVEPGGPIAILKRAFALTRGHTLRLLGAALLFAIGGSIAGLALVLATGAIVGLALGPPEPWSVSALIVATVSAAAQAVLAVVFTVYFARLYAQVAVPAGVPSSGT